MEDKLLNNIDEQRIQLLLHIQNMCFNLHLINNLWDKPLHSKLWDFIFQSLIHNLWIGTRTILETTKSNDQNVFIYLNRLNSFGIITNQLPQLTKMISIHEPTYKRIISETDVYYSHLTSYKSRQNKNDLPIKETMIIFKDFFPQITDLYDNIKFVFFQCEQLLLSHEQSIIKIPKWTIKDYFIDYYPDKHLNDVLQLFKKYENEDKLGFKSRT